MQSCFCDLAALVQNKLLDEHALSNLALLNLKGSEHMHGKNPDQLVAICEISRTINPKRRRKQQIVKRQIEMFANCASKGMSFFTGGARNARFLIAGKTEACVSFRRRRGHVSR